jgi:uncharacterized protein DUF5694
MQERLDGYLSRSYSLTPGEPDQIGLPLAKNLGLKKAHRIDFKMDVPMQGTFEVGGQKRPERSRGTDYVHGQYEDHARGELRVHGKHSLQDILCQANVPETDELGNQL